VVTKQVFPRFGGQWKVEKKKLRNMLSSAKGEEGNKRKGHHLKVASTSGWENERLRKMLGCCEAQ